MLQQAAVVFCFRPAQCCSRPGLQSVISTHPDHGYSHTAENGKWFKWTMSGRRQRQTYIVHLMSGRCHCHRRWAGWWGGRAARAGRCQSVCQPVAPRAPPLSPHCAAGGRHLDPACCCCCCCCCCGRLLQALVGQAVASRVLFSLWCCCCCCASVAPATPAAPSGTTLTPWNHLPPPWHQRAVTAVATTRWREAKRSHSLNWLHLPT